MSLDHPVLDQVVLGASSLFDVKRAPVAAHMTVFPQRPDAAIDTCAMTMADARAAFAALPPGLRTSDRPRC